MKFRLEEKTVSFSSAYSDGAGYSDVGGMGGDSYSLIAVVDVDTPSAQLFASTAVNTTTDIITKTAHGFSTGLKGQFTTSGALPTGLSLATDYYIIKVDADSFKVANSLANAQAGTAIDLTAQGSGNDTFTPTALAGGTIKLQGANYYNGSSTVWADIGSASNITVDANFGLVKDRPEYRYVRPYITLTAGHISATIYVLVKGDLD